MKFLKLLFAAAFVMVGLVSVVGCAAEDETTAPATDTEVTTGVDEADPGV